MNKSCATAAILAVISIGVRTRAHERIVGWSDGHSGPSSAALSLSVVREMAVAAQSPETVGAGQVAFDRVCKRCHGAEARGDAAPRLVPFSREYDELLGIVREGTGQMPPISVRELPDEEVAAIVAYLRSLVPA
jgi:mono/diheme cytochrome c family protein